MKLEVFKSCLLTGPIIFITVPCAIIVLPLFTPGVRFSVVFVGPSRLNSKYRFFKAKKENSSYVKQTGPFRGLTI